MTEEQLIREHEQEYDDSTTVEVMQQPAYCRTSWLCLCGHSDYDIMSRTCNARCTPIIGEVQFGEKGIVQSANSNLYFLVVVFVITGPVPKFTGISGINQV